MKSAQRLHRHDHRERSQPAHEQGRDRGDGAGDQQGRVAGDPGTHEFLGRAAGMGEELVAPAVPPDYGRRVLGGDGRGMLTVERTLDLLCGAVIESELPDQAALPIDALRRDFSPMP